jgi:Tol biopolymer transport system component
VPLQGGTAAPVAAEAPNAWEFAFSPNGRWLAYHDVVHGHPELFVKDLRGRQRIQISRRGGFQAIWSGDSRKLFYTSYGATYNVTTLDTIGTLPRVLTRDIIFPDSLFKSTIKSWDAHPDGKQFVVTRDLGTGPSLKVIENFPTLVRRKLARN